MRVEVEVTNKDTSLAPSHQQEERDLMRDLPDLRPPDVADEVVNSGSSLF